MKSMTFFLSFIPVLALILLGLNLVFAPHSPYQEKSSTFECGFHSFLGQNRTQFSISFFVFALLFLIFDLELVQIYPIALTFYTNEGYGLTVMLLFFLVLTLGFAFELGKKALNIESRQYNQTKILKSSLQKYITSFIKNYVSPFTSTIITIIIVVILLNWEKGYTTIDNIIYPCIAIIICKLLTDLIRHYAKSVSKIFSIYVAIQIIIFKIFCLVIWGNSGSLFKGVVLPEYFRDIGLPFEYIDILNNNLITIVAVCSILHSLIPYRAVWGIMVYLYKMPYYMIATSPILAALNMDKVPSKPESPVFYTPAPRNPPIPKVPFSRLPSISGDGYTISSNNANHLKCYKLDLESAMARFKLLDESLDKGDVVKVIRGEETLLNIIRAHIDGESIIKGREHLIPAVSVLGFRIEYGMELEKRDILVAMHLIRVSREVLRNEDPSLSTLPKFPYDP